jgi:hypothetical protein
MRSGFVNPKRKQTWSQSALLAIVGLAALIVSGDHAGARSGRSVDSVDPRTAGEPIMAIVSLHSQRITVYDASGWILRAPASSGQKGRETPAGIFSVIQKEAEHYSNLYDDAYMPHVQRITWSGIALHGGHTLGPGWVHRQVGSRDKSGFRRRFLVRLKRPFLRPGQPQPQHRAVRQSMIAQAAATRRRRCH